MQTFKDVSADEVMDMLDENEPKWYINYASQRQLIDLMQNRVSMDSHRMRVIKLYWAFCQSTFSALMKKNNCQIIQDEN